MQVSRLPTPALLATRPSAAPSGLSLPSPPAPEIRCRDGHYLIDDWYRAQARIREAEEEAIKARRVAGTLSFFGAVAATAGTVTMLAVPALLPLGLVGALVGTGLLLASGALRLASASKVSSVRRRAAAAYQKAERACRGRKWF
ncbi:MAG: hypothetical protein VKP62_10900 [Candidatus Sericytochromatia bacterium]|nr:hypothetical protein [Candidatus Sericytochromatia bacterium]